MKDINLILYDFDGVMTDNRVLLVEDGKEAVFVNRADGLAVEMIKGLGIAQMIVSTETNRVVEARAKKLGIPFLQAVKDKRKAVAEYLNGNNINSSKVIFVGNDINDKDVMRLVGWPVAVADAHKEIKKIAKVILLAKGGYGAIRELMDYIQSGRFHQDNVRRGKD